MKFKNINIDLGTTLLLLFFIFSSTINAQILDNLGPRNVQFGEWQFDDFSGIAYHPNLDLFIICNNKEVSNDFYFKLWDGDLATNITISGIYLEDDFEGITYLADNFFAVVEETHNIIYFMEYDEVANNLNIIGRFSTNTSSTDGIPCGLDQSDDDGLEGITYDPHSGRLFFIREHKPRKLYSLQLNITSSSVTVDQTVPLSEFCLDDVFTIPVDCFGFIDFNEDSDVAGIHHLGQNFNSENSLSNHMLILSEGNKLVIEFEVTVENNTINLTQVSEASIVDEPQPEGITVVCDQLYIVTEASCGNNFSSLSSYDLNAATQLDLTLFLEGAYDINIQLHSTELFNMGLLPVETTDAGSTIPGGQPYFDTPWNYAGNEGTDFTSSDYIATDVDWVLISLRTGINHETTVLRTAAILQSDGSIRLTDCILFPSGFYYIVIEHRNHLPIMSPEPIQVLNNTLTYDFTSENSYTSTSSGQKLLSTNEFAAFAGNFEQANTPGNRKDINVEDKSDWLSNNGDFNLYLRPDANLDGEVNGEDKTYWSSNNGVFSGINFN